MEVLNSDTFYKKISTQNAQNNLAGMSNVFVRAHKDMTLDEQKTFVYALSKLKFTEDPETDYVFLDKKVLAGILKLRSDANHLSVNLYNAIKQLPAHSFMQISEKDLGVYSNGFVVSSITRVKDSIRLHFNSEYIGLFTNLSRNYITLWCSDVYGMTSKRTLQFYELLRLMSCPKNNEGDNIYSYSWNTQALKKVFDVPLSGKGSYMRNKRHFNRAEFEKKVLDPVCEDLQRCNMIKLIVNPDGKCYQKIKQGGKVDSYRFSWAFAKNPKRISL